MLWCVCVCVSASVCVYIHLEVIECDSNPFAILHFSLFAIIDVINDEYAERNLSIHWLQWQMLTNSAQYDIKFNLKVFYLLSGHERAAPTPVRKFFAVGIWNKNPLSKMKSLWVSVSPPNSWYCPASSPSNPKKASRRTFSTPALSCADDPAGSEKPEMFLEALMRVEATCSLKFAFCSTVNINLEGSRSTGWV